MQASIQEINERVQKEVVFVETLLAELRKVIVGQSDMLDRLLIGLLSRGHILLEGVPGLAKTLAVRSLADAIDCKFQRIQFTPDLLPADLVGTLIYNQKDSVFVPKKGMAIPFKSWMLKQKVFASKEIAALNKLFTQRKVLTSKNGRLLLAMWNGTGVNS